MSIQLIERNSPTWRLFNLLYEVFIPELALYSTEYLKNNHVNISGDKELDKLRMNQLTRTKITTAGLGMLVLEGYEFGMVEYKDCVQIFSDVQGHLNLWREQTKLYTHPEDFPPIEELRAFESIALSVYNHAMRISPETHETSTIFNALINMNRIRNLTGTNKWLSDRIKETVEFKPYVSIVDEIERYVVESRDEY